MIRQLGSGQIPDIAEVISEVAKIKKMADELYNRSIIPKPMVIAVDPEILKILGRFQN